MKLLKFEKENCNPCTMVSNILDEKKVDYEKINPFNNPEMASRYRVRSVPTLILIENDVEIERVIGFENDKILEVINKLKK